jgi:hypothetical protein
MAEAEAEAEQAARLTRERERHERRTALCVVVGREQLLRKRMRRGDPPDALTTDVEALEAALLRLTAAVARLDEVDERPVGRPAGGVSPAARRRRG